MIVVLSCFIRKLLGGYALLARYGLHIFGVGPFVDIMTRKVTADSKYRWSD